jgi:hypothetical protein
MARYKIGTQIVNEQGQPDMSVFNEYSPGSQDLSSYMNTLSEYQAPDTSQTAGQVYSGLGNAQGMDSATMTSLGLSGINSDQQGNLSYSMPNQQDTYNSTLAMFQDEINSLNRVYAEQKSNLKNQLARKSAGELGSQRAIMGGAGMLGQVSGMGQKNELMGQQNERLNTGLSTIDAELNAKKSSLYSTARTLAQQSQSDKVKALQGGLDTYMSWANDKATKAQSNISNIVKTALANGVDMGKSDDYVKQIAKELGVSESDITAEFATQKAVFDKAQQEADKQALANAKTQAETDAINYKMQNPDINSVMDTSTGRVLLINKDNGQVIKDFGAVPVTGTETATAEQTNDNTITTLKDKISAIDTLLSDKAISSAVGPNFFGRIGFGGLTGSTQNFVAGVQQLVSKDTLDTLINLKKAGGTLGALSDQERIMLQSAASRIGSWSITDAKTGKVKGYNVDEKSFKKELNTIKTLTERALKVAEGESSSGTNLDSLRLKYSY